MTAYITPDVLVWARDRSNLTFDELAHKVNVKPHRISDWESGETHPTFRQAEMLANALHVPFGYFFLPSPPEINVDIPDRRTLSGGRGKPPSPEFLDTLDDATIKQDWYRNYLIRHGADPLNFLNAYSISSDVNIVANDIREHVNINDKTRTEARSWSNYLSILVANANDIGVVVLRNSVVGNNTRRPLSLKEFRAFVLYDEYAPLIFLNRKDSFTGMIFSLAHELTHLWIGESAISSPYYGGEMKNNHPTETFCNQVAAEVLVPREKLLAIWKNAASLERNLASNARTYWVSTLVILRRAYELNLIDKDTYHRQYSIEINKQIRDAARGSGGNPYLNYVNRNNRSIVTALVRDVYEGGTSYHEAAHLINVKPSTIDSLGEYLSV